MPANLAAALTNDCRVIDGTQTVTFTAKRSAGNVTATVQFADTDPVGTREIAASNGLFQAGDTRFKLWDRYLPAAAANKPLTGDEITDAAGVKWEILQATTDDLGLFYDCVCRKAR